MIYLLLDLKRKQHERMHARELVHTIEQAVIDTLSTYDLNGERKTGAPGIYVASGPWQGAKIAALGLKVRASGYTYHGVSLNVDMDLDPFSWINPCGYAGLETVDMKTLGAAVSLPEVQSALTNNLVERLKG